MGEKKASSDIGHAKRKILRRTVEVKKEIITKHENGVCVSDLAAEHDMTKSTISTIIKSNEVIKWADVAKEVTVISNQRPPILEEGKVAVGLYERGTIKR